MTTVQATEKDIPLIREIAAQSWRDNYAGMLCKEQIDYMLTMMYSEEELRRHLKNPNYHYFLIFDSIAKPVGIMGFEHHAEPGSTKLHRIYLLKESKGRGLGKMALDVLKNRVRDVGDTRIILNVNRNNPAIKFYCSQGFQVYAEGVFDIGNGFVMDDFLMEFFV
ncbi:MAG: GNAT family N-acetyltransferase [Weeksellaceae bacterium]|nr:GNAT family N-acetyltransferase [Weeksellaceae bacterium]